MLYGEELFIFDSYVEGVVPGATHQAAGTSLYTRNVLVPLIVRAFGFRVTTAINSTPLTTPGTVVLYQFPAGQTMLNFTGGTFAQPQVPAAVVGATSGATAKVVGITGQWGFSGTLFLYGQVGTFQAGETLTFLNGATAVNAQGGNSVTAQNLLGTINLPATLGLGMVVWCKVPNIPIDTNPAAPGPADMMVGDTLSVQIGVEPVGGSYNTGDIAPFILYHNRGEQEGNMPNLLDLTVPIVGV